jgi:hypothetical protein
MLEQTAQIVRQFGRFRRHERELGIPLAGRQIDDPIEELVQALQVRGEWYGWFVHGLGSFMIQCSDG